MSIAMLSHILAFSTMLCLLSAVTLAVERPVVVELFTSEGCSSCSPADASLTELSHAGRNVLQLAFHVTHRNGLGWKDTVSLEAATQRQARDGSRFGDGSYTPKMVVDGVRGFVGSERGEVGSGIQTARENRTAASVSVSREAAGCPSRLGLDAARVAIELPLSMTIPDGRPTGCDSVVRVDIA